MFARAQIQFQRVRSYPALPAAGACAGNLPGKVVVQIDLQADQAGVCPCPGNIHGQIIFAHLLIRDRYTVFHPVAGHHIPGDQAAGDVWIVSGLCFHRIFRNTRILHHRDLYAIADFNRFHRQSKINPAEFKIAVECNADGMFALRQGQLLRRCCHPRKPFSGGIAFFHCEGVYHIHQHVHTGSFARRGLHPGGERIFSIFWHRDLEFQPLPIVGLASHLIVDLQRVGILFQNDAVRSRAIGSGRQLRGQFDCLCRLLGRHCLHKTGCLERAVRSGHG